MKIPLTTILFLLFLALKLTGYINWSWIWVCSPLWITAIIYVLVIALGFFLVYAFNGKIKIRKKK